MIYVVMGVTGSGKTTIGRLLAKRLGIVFADADDFHSEANKQKMASGHPLTDADREPWLERLNGVLRDWYDSETSGVLACSALKQRYRTALGKGMPLAAVGFIHLDLPREVLAQRLAHRHHEFMDPNLLDSQLETLEVPHGSNVLLITLDSSPDAVVSDILQKLPSTIGTPIMEDR